MSEQSSRLVRFVVFHHPGPRWQSGIDFQEQEGVSEHVGHYLKLHQQGKLELDGPFLISGGGGMMIATKDVSREELGAFAAADPAIQSGLLTFEVRPWRWNMTRMSPDAIHFYCELK